MQQERLEQQELQLRKQRQQRLEQQLEQQQEQVCHKQSEPEPAEQRSERNVSLLIIL